MKLRTPKYLVSFFVVVLYLVSGTLIVLKYSVWQEPADMRLLLFGAVVIIYGAFRGFRAYREYQSQKEEENEME